MGFLSSLIKGDSLSDELALFIDITSDSVTGTLAGIPGHSSDSVRVLYGHIEKLPVQGTQDVNRLMTMTMSAIASVLAAIQKEGGDHLRAANISRNVQRKIKSVHCFLASPWYISQTKIVKVSKTIPTLVTRRLVSDVVKEEKNLMVRSLSGEEYGKKFGERLSLIESKTFSIKLDGYETSDPYDKKASQIEFAVYASMASQNFLKKIDETVKRVFADITLEFHTFPIVAFSAVREISTTPPDFLLLDIGAEISDISIVKKGVLLQTITLPLGENFFIRSISESLGQPIQVASSLFRLHAEGKYTTAKHDNLAKSLRSSKTFWKNSFSKALSEFSDELFLPKKLFFTANSGLAYFFLGILSEIEIKALNTDKVGLDPTLIDKDFLKMHYYLDTSALPLEKENTSALLESLFINKIMNKSWQKIS